MIPYGRHLHHDAVPGVAALEVSDLTVAYPDGRTALREVTLRVPAGQRLALVGPNGAGKSTLLKAVAGLLNPAAGRVRIYGQPVGHCRHRVAYLAQKGEVDWRFPISVRRLVLTGRYVHLGWLRRPRPADRRIAEDVMQRLGIAHLADRQIGALSGGQQQRVLLARALAQEAELLLLDEPTTAVDVDTRQVLTGVLDELQSLGRTLVVATHDHARRDAQYNQIVYLREGCQVHLSPERPSDPPPAHSLEHNHAHPA